MSDLRAVAEAARDVMTAPLDRASIAASERFEAAWSPDRALAALDVIKAAGDLADYPGSLQSLQDMRAALDRWDALNA